MITKKNTPHNVFEQGNLSDAEYLQKRYSQINKLEYPNIAPSIAELYSNILLVSEQNRNNGKGGPNGGSENLNRYIATCNVLAPLSDFEKRVEDIHADASRARTLLTIEDLNEVFPPHEECVAAA